MCDKEGAKQSEGKEPVSALIEAVRHENRMMGSVHIDSVQALTPSGSQAAQFDHFLLGRILCASPHSPNKCNSRNCGLNISLSVGWP